MNTENKKSSSNKSNQKSNQSNQSQTNNRGSNLTQEDRRKGGEHSHSGGRSSSQNK